MRFRDKIIAIERRLRAKKPRVSVNKICRDADVDRSTWSRWKAGATEANTRTWNRVKAALPEDVREAA